MNFPVNYERQNMTIMKRSIVWLAICFGFSIGFATTVLAQQDADSLRQKFQQNLAKAQQGDSNAQTSVGYAYDTGKGVSKDKTQAAIWYRKAAGQGNATAQCNLGLCFERGTGVQRSLENAKTWYRKAAERGDAKAQFLLAECFGDIFGDAPVDLPKSLKWYSKAANQGHVRSMNALADMYEEGQGVKTNLEQAVHWLKEANNFRGLYLFYERQAEKLDGIATVEEACQWRIQAAKGDNLHLGRLYNKGWRLNEAESSMINPDFAKAIVFYKKAAAQNSPEAMHLLAQFYEASSETKDNLVKAFKWKLKAAELGHSDSQQELAESFESGTYVEQDFGEAMNWHLKVVKNNRGNTRSSCVALHRIFASGELKNTSREEFEKHFKSAIETGLEVRFNTRSSWECDRRDGYDIGFYDELCRTFIEAGYVDRAKSFLHKLHNFAFGKDVSKIDQMEACIRLMRLSDDGIANGYERWKTRLENLIQESQSDILAGRKEKKFVYEGGRIVLKLARVYREAGETNNEEAALKQWLKLCDANGVSLVAEFGDRLASLGVAKGEASGTISFLEQRYRESKKTWPNFIDQELSLKLAGCLEHSDRLAFAYLRADKPDAAVRVFNEVLADNDFDVGNPEFIYQLSQVRATTAFQYAGLLQKKGELKKAHQIYEALLKRGFQEPSTLSGLAITQDEMGDSEKALGLFRKCESKWNLSWSFPGSMRYAKLLQLHRDAEAAEKVVLARIATHNRILKKIWPVENLTEFGFWLRMTYENYDLPELFLTDLYVNGGKLQKAFEHQDKLIQNSTSYAQTRLAYLTEERRKDYLRNQFQVIWMKALSFAKYNSDDSHIASLTASWLLNGKGIEHDVLAESTLMSSEKLAPTVSALKRIRSQMASLTSSQKELRKPEQDSLDSLKQRQEELESKLVFERIQRTGIEPWVTMENLRKAIPGDSSFISLARITPYDFQKSFESVKKMWGKPRYYAWVIPPSGKGDVRFVDLGDAKAIDDVIAKVRLEVTRTTSNLLRNGEQQSEKALQRLLNELSRLIYQPLAGHVADSSELVISPDGNLWTLPWEMLREDGKYLVESKRIRYVTSGRELTRKASKQVANSAPAIFAGVDYDWSFKNLSKHEEPGGEKSMRSGHGRFAPLSYSLAEAKSVLPSIQRYTGEIPVEHLGANASESRFKDLKQPEVLMISSHGYFHPGKYVDNALLRCGLAFAGANNGHQSTSADREDGVVTGLEVVGTDLRGTDLVVLSACETGVGEIQNGEGVAGLRQAFQVAGAQSVVSSLWQVEDGETARLMKLFFENLAAGKSKSESLRQAQLTRIKARHGAAHPFFWAAFTLTGQD